MQSYYTTSTTPAHPGLAPKRQLQALQTHELRLTEASKASGKRRARK